MTTVIKNRRTKQEQNPKLAWVMPCKKEEDESQRAGGAAVVIELMEQREQSQRELNSAESRQKKKKTKSQHDGSIISRDVISDLHTTEFRMMLTLMVKVMSELPDG